MAKRENFSKKTIETCKQAAAFICSRAECRTSTVGPSPEDKHSGGYIGKVCHISAASEGGPRYLPQMTSSERTAISNAIFLCSNCSDLIDKNNGKAFSIEMLNSWKDQHRNWLLAHGIGPCVGTGKKHRSVNKKALDLYTSLITDLGVLKDSLSDCLDYYQNPLYRYEDFSNSEHFRTLMGIEEKSVRRIKKTAYMAEILYPPEPLQILVPFLENCGI
ncbi:hypothetical protein [Pedobacter sp. R-06]|uniref:hypothetical protein n=1 Tax=Pedobacter sp. R-06 TaxID=3404051 RepID=UPI003CE96020